MRKPSRFMPPTTERRAGFFAYIALATMSLALLYSLWVHPVWTLAALSALAVASAISWKSQREELLGLAARRANGSGICAFARSFDLRQVDSWVVRAVYEELAHHFKGLEIEVQINADDDIIEDLQIDPEDLDMGIALDIAARTGRTFEGFKANPYLSDTNSVRGLVMFFNAQPRAA